MQSQLKRTFQIFLFSNLFISFCAVAQGLLTYFLLGIHPDKYILSLLFFATLLIYNIDRIIYSNMPASIYMTERKELVNEYANSFRVLAYFSAVAIFIILFFLPLKIFSVLIPLAIISVAYSVPILSDKGKIPALKYWYGQKAFVIATVWSVSCVLIPIIASSILLSVLEISLILAARFFFIIVLCIQFDIRDVEQDRANKWNTIPVIFGIKRANAISYLLLVLFMVIIGINSFYIGRMEYMGMLVSAIFTGMLIHFGSYSRSENYYSFFMDGMMIIQVLLVILFNVSSG